MGSKGIGRGNHPNSRAQGRRNIRPGWSKPGPGRPKGSIEARKQLMLALKGESPGLLKRLVKSAKSGDVVALRTLLAPLIAPAKTNVMSYRFATKRESLADILIEFQNLEKNMSVGAVDAEEVAAVTKVLERHRETLLAATAGDARREYELDAAVFDKILARYPKAYETACRMVSLFQRVLIEEDWNRRTPVTEVPRQLVERAEVVRKAGAKER